MWTSDEFMWTSDEFMWTSDEFMWTSVEYMRHRLIICGHRQATFSLKYNISCGSHGLTQNKYLIHHIYLFRSTSDLII